MQFQEVVEAQGHLIDSHVMEQIFDQVVEFGGRFEVEEFRVGRTNSEPSYLRLKVEAADRDAMERLLQQLLGLGCSPVDSGDAQLRIVERDRCAPEDFYSTTNHRTLVRHRQQWIEVENQRMDALVVVADGRAVCRRMRDLRAGDQVVVGMRGIRVVPESKERDRLAFAFMSNGISSERQVETAVRQTAALIEQTIEQGLKVVAVAGPVVVHTGGVQGLAQLDPRRLRPCAAERQRAGRARCWRRLCLARRSACGWPTGARKSTVIAITCAPSMRSITAAASRQAVESGRLRSGILYECVKKDVPFVLAGSLRDDGPLPDTITDMNEAQDAYAEQLKGAGLVLCLGSMLHSIATGNMLPSWVKIVCVDINPAVATKVSDRGTGQAVGVVTDVGLFLDLLARALVKK